MTTPKDLKAGGRQLWRSVTERHDLTGAQLATLEAACRQRDRADQLGEAASTGDPSALRHEREASLAMARLIASLRLPDPATGRRPQLRGIRGVHAPVSLPSVEERMGRPSALKRARDRARERGQMTDADFLVRLPGPMLVPLVAIVRELTGMDEEEKRTTSASTSSASNVSHEVRNHALRESPAEYGYTPLDWIRARYWIRRGKPAGYQWDERVGCSGILDKPAMMRA